MSNILEKMNNVLKNYLVVEQNFQTKTFKRKINAFECIKIKILSHKNKLGIRKSIFHAYNKGLISLPFKYMCMYACVYTIHTSIACIHTHTHTKSL